MGGGINFNLNLIIPDWKTHGNNTLLAERHIKTTKRS